MQRKHLVLATIAALIAAVAVYLLAFRGGGGKAKPAAPVGSGPERATVDPRHEVVNDAPDRAIPERDLQARLSRPDPDGPLRLEGQVLGEDEQPVAGAKVWITSQPPRSATTEGDGTFAFDKLLPRAYTLSARAGDTVGGPVSYALAPGAEPVVIRLRQGAKLTVRVSDESSGEAIAGATVTLTEMDEPSQTTGGDGVAAFGGLGGGFTGIKVRASGFAPVTTFSSIGVAGSAQEVSVALRKGAALAGKVVDEAGAGVAGAVVTIKDAGAPWALDADSAVSDDDGGFRFVAVAAGSYLVAARDLDHAPGLSEIISLDGVSPKEDVRVVLPAGGIVRGRVVTADHQPAAFATVEVAGKDPQGGPRGGFGGGTRSTTADDQGVFAVTGLPRTAARVRGESSDAASQIVDVDLTTTGTVEGVELVLDVTGTISGVVVDGNGDPVAEAQVSAFTDFFGGGDREQLEDLAFAGLTATTTDGGGAFRLRGLPDGKYRLWASRTTAVQQIYRTEGTPAKPGDHDVRIVLPAPGGIEATIAMADGSTPKLAMVAIGVMPASPVRDGHLEVHDLAPGSYDLHVRGPDFAELIQRGVVVEAGKIKDLGTLTVKEGRRVAGVVVDDGGNPVEGARVMVGTILFSEGGQGGNSQAIQDMMGVHAVTTDAEGRFVVVGATEKAGAVMAEHPDRGRSDSIALAAGTDHVTDLRLVLRGFGSVAGKVVMEGEPLANTQVMASSEASTGHVVVVATGADGTFVIDKLPEGQHKLTAQKMANFQMTSGSTDVTVKAGQRSEVTIEIPVGTITLTVEVKGRGNSKPDAAQVFLFRGVVGARTAQDIVDRFLHGDAAGMGFWMGGDQFPKFEKLIAGGYTECTLPINGSLADMQFQQRLQENLDKLDVYCDQVTVAASPDQQTHTATVPAMKPLPAD
ncbi:MAG: carboxypeptidase regulatory-like domain-containing protein [Kofleriaceae bacterium]|nr:carboxypeptidase regulatory-like domain-containing protein [Myxococcales bacterium]MCB9563013.1 carboxypeptidase regulatory-like domain-containing protein [Kofleriaceae bacterium]